MYYDVLVTMIIFFLSQAPISGFIIASSQFLINSLKGRLIDT